MSITIGTLALANRLAERGFSPDAISHSAGLSRSEARSIIAAAKYRVARERRRRQREEREAQLRAAFEERRKRLAERQEARIGYPDLKQLVADVAAKHGLTLPEMLAQGRQAAIVQARHEAMYLAAKMTLASTPQIGRALGGMDHTSVLHGIKKHAARNNLPLPRGMKA